VSPCVAACRILFDGNEEEYEDFYDYAAGGAGAGADGAADTTASSTAAADGTGAADSAKQLALALNGLSIGSSGAAGGWELAVPSQGSAGGKILGSRELARYYKQRPKPQDNRRSVIVNTIIAQYRSLGLATKTSTPPVVERAAQRQQQQMQKRQHQLLYSRNNVNFNLPKNVTY
jgi:pre-60S factor REI1